jgi:hypothetical protein
LEGIYVSFPPGACGNPSVRLGLDGETIAKREFDKNGREVDWQLNIP